MKKIIMFGGWIPDVIEKFMEEHNLDYFSPELRCHPDLIKMVENARVVTVKDLTDGVHTELKRTGELYRPTRATIYAEKHCEAYYVSGYNSERKDFCRIIVCTYDETHRHFFSEIDGHEFLFDLEKLRPSSYLPKEYNLWDCTGRVVL